MTIQVNSIFSSEVSALAANSIDAVLFDLDGTLIDSVPDLAAAIDVMLLSIGKPSAGEEKVNRWVGNGAAALVKRALFDDDRGDVLHQQAFIYDGDDPDYAQAYAVFEQAYEQQLTTATGMYAGVESTLRLLHDAGIKMALITNKPRRFTLPLLAALTIDCYFSCVLCGDDLPEKKPHPLPVETALKELQVNASNAVMVGDSISDVKSARLAQVKSVAVTYGYNHGVSITDASNEMLADVFINHMQQLLN
jgi:phosphoglycolate phosphatase